MLKLLRLLSTSVFAKKLIYRVSGCYSIDWDQMRNIALIYRSWVSEQTKGKVKIKEGREVSIEENLFWNLATNFRKGL